MKVMICAMVLMALTAFSVRAANVGDEVQVVFACGDLDAAKSVAKIGSENDAAGKISVYEIEPANGRKLVPYVYAIGGPSGQGA